MGLFDFFPYTSGHTLNLDWIIKQVKGFSSALASHVDNKNNPHNVTAEQVGARSDNWLPTAEQIGAVPDGVVEVLNRSGDLNECNLIGRSYGISAADGIANLPPVRDSSALNYAVVVNEGCTSAVFTQILYAPLDRMVFRRSFVSWNTPQWTVWEVENPYMQLGVEYRTTERHNGKPVYAFHGSYLSQTELTSGQTIMIPTGIANMADCFKCFAKINGFYVTVGVSTDSTAIHQVVNGEIHLTNSDSYYGAGFTVNYTLYYTKTTD